MVDAFNEGLAGDQGRWHPRRVIAKYSAGERPECAAMAFSVIGLLLVHSDLWRGLHGLHPLAVGSEFFRGHDSRHPMLVIILYIGLPLSGAVKDATGGGIDLPNFTRGVIAIAIGYSAYMAEIFRSGIEAVPKGRWRRHRAWGCRDGWRPG